MARARPLSGPRNSTLAGAFSGPASRACWDGLTSAGDEDPGLRNSERKLREVADSAGARVDASTGFESGCFRLRRTSFIRDARAPGVRSLSFGSVRAGWSVDGSPRVKPRDAGTSVDLLSASARA